VEEDPGASEVALAASPVVAVEVLQVGEGVGARRPSFLGEEEEEVSSRRGHPCLARGEVGVELDPPFLPSRLVDPVVEGACHLDLHLVVLGAGAVAQGVPDGTDQEALEALVAFLVVVAVVAYAYPEASGANLGVRVVVGEAYPFLHPCLVVEEAFQMVDLVEEADPLEGVPHLLALEARRRTADAACLPG